jgi:hypothetical protein
LISTYPATSPEDEGSIFSRNIREHLLAYTASLPHFCLSVGYLTASDLIAANGRISEY